MKNCGKCGAANNDQADFCSLCMTSFPKTEGASPGPAPSSGQAADHVGPPNSEGAPKPAPINVYEEMQTGVKLDEDRSVTPGTSSVAPTPAGRAYQTPRQPSPKLSRNATSSCARQRRSLMRRSFSGGRTSSSISCMGWRSWPRPWWFSTSFSHRSVQSSRAPERLRPRRRRI